MRLTAIRALWLVVLVFAIVMAWAFHGKARAQPLSAQNVIEHRQSIRALVSTVAREQRVPDAVAHALVARESGYRVHAVGREGEIGLTQIKLSTARAMGFRGSRAVLFSPRINLTFGLMYARMALDRGGIRFYRTGLR